jgi:PAS domain S-box-containing protein
MTIPNRILFVGESEDEFTLTGLVLHKQWPEARMQRAAEAVSFAEAVADADFQLLLLTEPLTWAGAFDLIRPLNTRCPGAPVILFSDRPADQIGAEARRRGAQACLPRTPAGYARLPEVARSLLEKPAAPTGESVSESDLGRLLDDATIGTYRATLDGRIVRANEAFLRITGLNTVEDYHRVNLHELGHHPGEWSDRMKRLQEEGTQHHPTVQIRHVQGTPIWVSLSERIVTPARESGPVVDGVVVDVTERKRLEEELSKNIQELARSNSDLEQFAHTASHELQEPLRTVERYTKLLAAETRDQLTGESAEALDFILGGTRRMQSLVDDLLSYSRLMARGQPFKPVDCETLFSQALSNLQGSIDESGAEVTHDPLPCVAADAAQLATVFQNLISNAIKFRNIQPPHVHISSERRNGDWVFSVRDNGIGIEKKNKNRIFTIFQRLHTDDEYPGTGVGLAICKRIVERHGGRIWVESKLGEGSTFLFSIPQKTPAPALPEAAS